MEPTLNGAYEYLVYSTQEYFLPIRVRGDGYEIDRDGNLNFILSTTEGNRIGATFANMMWIAVLEMSHTKRG